MTLAKSGEYEVHIIGFPSINAPTENAITVHPMVSFSRFSFKRFVAGFQILRRTLDIKPDVIIINTPELLPVAIVNRLFFGRKIIYDVLENYFRNIRYTTAYPAFARWPLALMVRLLEKITAPLIHHFFLAETGYRQEIGFARSYTILENKLPKSIIQSYKSNQPRENHRLLFSGTLAESTGVFEAIELCKELHKIDTAYSLTLIGYCAMPDTLAEIKRNIADKPFITLVGGDQLVPHEQILHEISRAGWGIVIYPPNPSTESSIPTKVYEYLAFQLPMIIRHTTPSHAMVQEYKGGIILPAKPDFQVLIGQLKTFPKNPDAPADIFWESEGLRLIECLRKL
ncbi:MAG: hypothetical protein WAZ98_09205 [Cyclobacteriaceae bacterium]